MGLALVRFQKYWLLIYFGLLIALQSTVTLLCQNILQLTKENKRDALLIQADSLISPLYVPSISLQKSCADLVDQVYNHDKWLPLLLRAQPSSKISRKSQETKLVLLFSSSLSLETNQLWSDKLQLREYQKDLEYRLHHHLLKFERSVFVILKPISYFFAVYMAWFFI